MVVLRGMTSLPSSSTKSWPFDMRKVGNPTTCVAGPMLDQLAPPQASTQNTPGTLCKTSAACKIVLQNQAEWLVSLTLSHFKLCRLKCRCGLCTHLTTVAAYRSVVCKQCKARSSSLCTALNFTCAFKPASPMSHIWLPTPDCKSY